MKKKVIVIDGPAGSGKSTVALKLAQKLNYTFLDTGALYRAIALKASLKKIPPKNTIKLYNLSKAAKISFQKKNETQHVFLDKKDVTLKIRTREISKLASQYSALPVVRKALLYQQRELGKKGGLVAEGRDLGTVVFPKAECKFFLSASVQERAKRRYLELKEKMPDIKLLEIEAEVAKRDQEDSQRKIAPLKKAKDAIEIDTTSLTIDQVVEELYKRCL